MKKILKRVGRSSLMIYFSPDDIKINNLKMGDIVEFEFKKIGENNVQK